MKNIRAVIIDDEPAAIEVIRELAKELAEDIQIIDIALDGVKAVKSILANKPDLVFLDMNMPFMNGLQVLDKIPVKNFDIIFTTGSASFAINAIKLQAVDYLLKPIDPSEFLVAIEKLRNKMLLQNKPGPENRTRRKIQFSTQHGIMYLEESSIVQIIGMGSYCQIITNLGPDKIIISKNIGYIGRKLSDGFFRCHNSHIINLDFINGFSTKDGYSVNLKNGQIVEVSRRCKSSLLQKLSERAI
ncbi:MAG TPA: response regulator [Chitinophagaceae bacterium]|jgi:two-component system LytT family response regulator|nr:response regulator [Chitinophagaceae bacterium]